MGFQLVGVKIDKLEPAEVKKVNRKKKKKIRKKVKYQPLDVNWPKF